MRCGLIVLATVAIASSGCDQVFGLGLRPNDASDGSTTGSEGGGDGCDAPCELLASGHDRPIAMAFDAAHLFWINEGSAPGSGSVMSCDIALCGATTKAIATMQARPRALVAVGGVVAWTTLDDGRVWLHKIGGTGVQACGGLFSAPVLLGIEAYQPMLLVVSDGTSIRAFDVGSGPNPTCANPRAVVSGESNPRSWAYESAVLGHVWISDLGSGAIRQCADLRTSCTPTTLIGGEIGLDALNADASAWTVSARGGALRTFAPTGARTVAEDLGAVSGIASSNAFHYVAIEGSGTDGVIAKIANVGGPLVPVAHGQRLPSAIAVLDPYVYWTNAGDGTVMRALK